MIYTTEHFPIKLEYWYIVSLGDFKDITLYSVYFINKVSAQRAVSRTFARRKRSRYVIKSGRQIKEYLLKYKLLLGKMPKFRKYDFPENSTPQQRKTRRTVIRRRLRRMGMLVPKRHKLTIGEPVKQSRLLVNRQKVADCPNTVARAFRLESKPKRFYYVIINKERSSKNGIMFRIEAVRYDKKKGKYKKVLLNINNKDVIIPHLISEVYTQALNNNQYEEFKRYCITEGVKLSQTTPKKVLS